MTTKELSAAQNRASNKLTREWQSAYGLQESLATLDALVKHGLCIRRGGGLGSIFSPRTSWEYKLK